MEGGRDGAEQTAKVCMKPFALLHWICMHANRQRATAIKWWQRPLKRPLTLTQYPLIGKPSVQSKGKANLIGQ